MNTRTKRGRKNTRLMRDQRNAVIAYLKSRGRSLPDLTLNDCRLVWNSHRTHWNRCAKRTDSGRGYRNCFSLYHVLRKRRPRQLAQKFSATRPL